MTQRDHGRDRRLVGPPGHPGGGVGGRPVATAVPPAGMGVRTVTAPGARAHAQRPHAMAPVRALLIGLATTLAVFALAVALVTVLEVVVDHPLSGGAPGATTLGELIHPRLGSSSR